MKHREKQRLARRLITALEIKRHVPIFQSKAWETRKQVIAERVARAELKGGE